MSDTVAPMRLRLGLALVSAAGAALVATAALGGTARAGATATYKLVFQGSGRATSTYPPLPTGTEFTSTITWTLVYEITVSPDVDSSWTPQGGSSITGGSDGVATASGGPIEPGCQHIGFSLDATQQGGEFDGVIKNGLRLRLMAPGFDAGALLAYSPGQCSDPFPSDCPDRLGAQTVDLDTTKAQQSWQLSGTCDLSAEGQTASWSGTVKATRAAVSSGDGGSGSGCTLAAIGLDAVAADAADDAWAAGVCGGQGAVEHWNGKQWSLVSLPSQPVRQWRVNGIAAVAPNDVWIAGYGQAKNADDVPIVLHWTGARWTSVTGPLPRRVPLGGFQLNAIAATSAGAWVVGIAASTRGLVEHAKGSSFASTLDRATPTIAQTVFSGVAVLSPQDVWIVGNSNERGGAALTERWNGRSWREVRTPNEKTYELAGAASAGGSTWAVGSGGYSAGVIERWSGSHWSIQARPAIPLVAVAASSGTNAWAVGWSARRGGLIEQWDGRRWSAQSMGDLDLTGVATTSAGDAWAVAGGTILHWDGHTWTSVQSG